MQIQGPGNAPQYNPAAAAVGAVPPPPPPPAANEAPPPPPEATGQGPNSYGGNLDVKA